MIPAPANYVHAPLKEDVSITINVNDGIKNDNEICLKICWMEIPHCPNGWVSRLYVRNSWNIPNVHDLVFEQQRRKGIRSSSFGTRLLLILLQTERYPCWTCCKAPYDVEDESDILIEASLQQEM